MWVHSSWEKGKILDTDADAHKKKQESLSPEDKDLFEKNHTAAQHKHPKSLSSDQKAQVNTKDAAEHKKHRESLSSEQKGQTKLIDAAAHKRKYELLPPEKKSKTRGNYHWTMSWTFDRRGEENLRTDKICCCYPL